jgi:hypothetical protein
MPVMSVMLVSTVMTVMTVKEGGALSGRSQACPSFRSEDLSWLMQAPT